MNDMEPSADRIKAVLALELTAVDIAAVQALTPADILGLKLHLELSKKGAGRPRGSKNGVKEQPK